MKEYIERDAALKAFEPQCGDWSECWSAEEIKPKLESIPAADVVEVVRCRDCLLQRGCKPAQYLGDDGFCSHGERKVGADDADS